MGSGVSETLGRISTMWVWGEPMDFVALKEAIQGHRRLITFHAVLELEADGLEAAEVWASMLDATAEIIEDYAADPRGSSCLILSFVVGCPVHTVVAYPSKRAAPKRGLTDLAVMVTAYRPDRCPQEWSTDYRQRQPRS